MIETKMTPTGWIDHETNMWCLCWFTTKFGSKHWNILHTSIATATCIMYLMQRFLVCQFIVTAFRKSISPNHCSYVWTQNTCSYKLNRSLTYLTIIKITHCAQTYQRVSWLDSLHHCLEVPLRDLRWSPSVLLSEHWHSWQALYIKRTKSSCTHKETWELTILDWNVFTTVWESNWEISAGLFLSCGASIGTLLDWTLSAFVSWESNWDISTSLLCSCGASWSRNTSTCRNN